MRECPDTLIHVICEACFNLCHHQILKDADFEDREKDASRHLNFSKKVKSEDKSGSRLPKQYGHICIENYLKEKI